MTIDKTVSAAAGSAMVAITTMRLVMTLTSWFGRRDALFLALALTVAPAASPAHAAETARKVSVVSFGLFGDQGVFRSEATGAAQVVASRFGGGPANVQYNSKQGGGATVDALATALQASAKGIDTENDVLFLILTSHGSPAGLAVKAGRLTQTLTPPHLADMLARTGVRHKVTVISACYSGVFIPHLASPDTLAITAADANHPSFGCQDKAKWTYFGDAFFNVALRKAKSLKDAFTAARELVLKRELRERFQPSNPQMAGGENVQPLLVARP
jgi:Peptidase C13 family